MTTLPESTEAVKSQLTEASHSVNLFFEVEGYGKAQATGRGFTAHDAAQNLADTITATRALLAPPAPVEPPMLTNEQRLAQMLVCGIQRAWAMGDEGLEARMIKAAKLVRAEAVQLGNREGLYAVRSLHAPETWYEVEAQRCTCPDYAKHFEDASKYRCKHVLAVMMYERLSEPQ